LHSIIAYLAQGLLAYPEYGIVGRARLFKNRVRTEVAIEDRHASDNDSTPPPAGNGLPAIPTPGLSAKGNARRRFTRAGAGATGVMLTLYSQPGMACTYCGLSASAAISAIGQNKAVGTLSHKGPTPVCNGQKPSTWCTTSSWPTGCSPGDFFHKYFTCTVGSSYYKETCQSVLAGASCDSTKMAQYMMAAYLNIVSGRINFLSVKSLTDAWDGWVANGYYEPIQGKRWYANDIVAYLYGTMD
jgi:hypothetical protein